LPRRVNIAPARTSRWHEIRAWLGALRRDARDPRFLGLAVWFTGYAAAFAGVFFQLLSFFQTRGVSTANALWTVALIGPMQVAGRFALATRGQKFSSLSIGAWAMGALASGMLVLVLCPPKLPWLLTFAGLFGLGNGVMTILRGTAVAELFGHDRYAELNGALALPSVMARAASPVLLGACWTITGKPEAAFAGVLALLAVGAAGLAISRRATSLSAAIASPAPV
jgi:hypothetical protein